MPKPNIELLYYPTLTIAPPIRPSTVRRAQVVIALMIRDTHFADVARVVWAAAARCYLDQVHPDPADEWQQGQTPIYPSTQNRRALRLGKPYPEVSTDGSFLVNADPVFNGPGLRESLRLRKTLARGPAGAVLDGPMIARLLNENFNFYLRGFESIGPNDPLPTIENAGIFPMIPGLMLIKPSGRVDFRTYEMRDSDFEDRFDDALAEVWGSAEPGSSTSTGEPRGMRSFAELAFEQYFDRLLSSANDLFDQGCELWFGTHSGPRKLGDAIFNPFDDRDPGNPSQPDRPRILSRFRGLLAQLSADFCSGLRIPADFDPRTNDSIQPFRGFYEWTGQQFELPPIPLNSNYPYQIELGQRFSSPASWIRIDPAPLAPATTELNGVAIDGLLRTSFAPAVLGSLDELSPLQASDRRYSFLPALRWRPAPASSARSIWPMASVMQREIRSLVTELSDRAAVRLDCRLEMAGNQNSNDDANSVPLPSAKWATIVPLMIRQVADTTKPAGAKVAHLYELVGMSEKDRRLLDLIYSDSSIPNISRIDLLYQVAGDEWISDSVDMAPASTECLLFRTNLTTESAPTQNSFRASSAIEGADIASLGSTKDFIRLVQNACIVNSGGYFLRYEPAPDADPLAALFVAGVSQQRQRVMLTLVYGSVASDSSPWPYYNAIESDTPTEDPDRDPLVFAFIERKVSAQNWHRLIQHDARFAPGSVGFRASRRRVPKPNPQPNPDPVAESAFLLDNLFSRLGYEIEPKVNVGSPSRTDLDDLNAGRIPALLDRALSSHGIKPSPAAALATTTADRDWKLTDVDFEFGLRMDSHDELLVIGVYRHFPMTLPVQPREPGRSFGDGRTIDPANWHWEHVIQVLRDPFRRPYDGIGQAISIDITVRDGFGNEFPAEGGPTVVAPKLVYFDKLIGVAEWPAAKTELRAVGTPQNPDIVVELSAIPFGTPTSDFIGCAPLPPAEKVRVIQRYTSIARQLADDRVECHIVIDSKTDDAAGTRILIECKQQLQSFVEEVLTLGANPSAAPCSGVVRRMPFGTPYFDHPGDFFELQVVLEIKRVAPSSDYFAKVRFPWKNSQDDFAPAKLSSSPIGLPGTLSNAGDESPLVRLANAFQFKYPAGVHALRLGTAEGDEQDRNLWLVRHERLQPDIRRYAPPLDGTHLVFAAAPLSTELLWRRVTNLPGDIVNGGTAVAERTFTEIDLDVRTRDCFAALERFLEPATVSLVVKSVGSSGAQDGWESFQSLMNSKRKLSGSAPEKCLSNLFVHAPPISPCVKGAALAAYRQCVLAKLTGFYEIDGLFPFQVFPPGTMTANSGGGVALFGKVRDRIETGILNARTSDVAGTLTMDAVVRSIQVGSVVDVAWSDNGATVYTRNAQVVSVSGTVIDIQVASPPVLPAQGTNVSVSVVPLSQALGYRNSKIRYFPQPCQTACTLMLVVDQLPPKAGEEHPQPRPRPLTFEWTHVEFDVPVPTPGAGGCCQDEEFPTSRWLTLVNPISVEIEGGRNCELALPVRQFPIAPRIVSHQAISPVRATSIEAARTWEYRLNLSIVMDAVDELQVTAKLNVPLPPTRADLVGAGQICDSVLRFQSAFPKPDDAYAAIRTKLSPGGSAVDGLLIAKEFARLAAAISDSFEMPAPFVSRLLRTGPELRDVNYTVRDEHDPNLGGNGRKSSIEWAPSDNDLRALIKPEHNLNAAVTSGAYSNVASFTERPEDTELPDEWRARRITIGGLNALVYESCASELVLYRNRHIIPIPGDPVQERYRVKPDFVYVTPATSTPAPVVALIDVSNPIPLAIAPQELSLTTHLTNLFRRFFDNLDPSADKRRVRCEIKYSFPAHQFADPGSSPLSWEQDYGIRSAQRLLPPRDVDVADPANTVRDLVQNLASWRTDFDPDQSGAIVIDLLAYSILSVSDLDRPLVRVRHIFLPLSQIMSPWS